MKEKINSLVNTNKYLREQRSIEDYLASSTTSSTLVEGVKIRNPHVRLSEISKKNIRLGKPRYDSLWD